MADGTGIQWTDATWNPVRGCTAVSPGCLNCYAARTALRHAAPGRPYDGLAKRNAGGLPIWTGEVRTVPAKLDEPLGWREPRRIFVNSMSDLFHEDVPEAFIDRVWAMMWQAQWHTFQVLTKRPERMAAYLAGEGLARRLAQVAFLDGSVRSRRDDFASIMRPDDFYAEFAHPAPNVWLGVSVEDQKRADERIPLLRQCPAAVRFLSVEPMLRPVDLTPWIYGIDWVIVGGESGPGARPCHTSWVRSVVKQCKAAGVPVFVKQLGSEPKTPCPVCHGAAKPKIVVTEVGSDRTATFPGCRECGDRGVVAAPIRDRKGGEPAEWPSDLRVREFPVPVAIGRD